MNSFVPNARYPVRCGYEPVVTTAQCLTLDSFCEQQSISRVDLLKIDAEGFDLSVIKGAARMLGQGRVTFVYVEFNDFFDLEGSTGGSLLPIALFLRPFGLRYVASYVDRIQTDGPMFISANALFAKDLRAAENALSA